jgi:hypothetical protein
MCRVPTPIDARSMADRPPKAPRSTRGQKPDGRSAGARRFRALVAAFSADLGDLNEADRAMVRTAATLALKMELLQGDLVAGKDVDSDQLIRLAGTSRRALAAVSAKAIERKPAGTQTLQEYLAAKAAAAELVDDDQDSD